jgi:hypothetical protein
MSRHRSSQPLWTAALFVTLAMALGGCVAAPPEPTQPPETTIAPTTAPVVDPGPAPRIDATCDDILDSAALQDFMGLVASPLAVATPADRLTPDRAAGEQLGALACTWTNGLQVDPFTGPDIDGQSVRLSILPEGIDDAIAYVDLYQIADPTYGEHVQGPRCLGPADGMDGGYCELFGVIGQTWVELTVDGIAVQSGTPTIDLLAGFRSVIDPLVARVGTMEPHERWAPSKPSTIGEAACDVLTPTDAIAATTGIPELSVGPHWDGPHVGQYWYATTQTGAQRCSLGMSDSDASIGQIGILPSGAWAYDRYHDAWIAAGGTPVAVPGVADGDAIARCVDAAAECNIDLRVAGAWIRVTVYPVPELEPEYGPPIAYYESARSSAADIAAIVAAQVTAAA